MNRRHAIAIAAGPGRLASPHRRRGAVMMESVLILPLLLLILSLIFYIGFLSVRVQRDTVLPRYEVWREVYHASGPGSDRLSRNLALNNAFFEGEADSLLMLDEYYEAGYERHGRMMPDVYDEHLFAAAGDISAEAQELAETQVYWPDYPDLHHTRWGNAYEDGYRVRYTMDIPLWEQLDGPIVRRHMRITHEWLHSNSTTAGPDTWRGGSTGDHHLRAARDIYLEDLDLPLDDMDGDQIEEYNNDFSNDPTQVPDGSVLAGMIRRLYLDEAGYSGPIVYDER